MIYTQLLLRNQMVQGKFGEDKIGFFERLLLRTSTTNVPQQNGIISLNILNSIIYIYIYIYIYIRLAGFNSQSNARPGLRDYLFRAVQAISFFSVL